MQLSKQYRPWLFGFVIINIIASLIMYGKLELIGDLAGTKINDPSTLWLSLCLISLSYILLMYPFYSSLQKIKITKIKFKKTDKVLGEKIGVVVFILQLLFFLFNSYYGVNTAGSNNTTADTPLALLWVVVPADTLFVIYYAFYRDNKFFKLNVTIWLLSNLIRGWAGIFLFIIFFEWCRLRRRGVIHLGKMILAGSVIITLYPILSIFKWIMRSAAGKDIDFSYIITESSSNLAEQDYIQLILFGLEHIIARLQLTSILVDVINLKESLQLHFRNGDFLPFWMEGLHGIFIERLFYGEKTMTVGVAFTEYASFGWVFDIGDWNINVSLPAWFFITPYLSVIYVFYIMLLCFISIFFVKLIGENEGAKDLIWLTWLVYLIPLWLGTFVAFIYALLVFLIIKYILSIIPNIRIRTYTYEK